MKRYIIFLLLITGTTCFSNLFAQSMKTYNWKPYKTTFQIPDEFTVEENNSEKFMATATGINFTIYPKKGENLSLGKMKTAVKDWATTNKLKNVGDVTVLDESKYNGFWGVSIEGVKNDFPVTQMLLVHPQDNNISFYVWISYSFAKKNLVDKITENIRALTLVTSEEQSKILKDYTWKSYKTKFRIPEDYEVSASSGDKFIAGNKRMSLSIYPRKGENLSDQGKKDALKKWAGDNDAKDLSKITELDSDKLNGYWGIFIEGTRNGYPEIYMLIVNPKDSDIYLYVNLSYQAGLQDLALDILKSIAPMDDGYL